MVQYANGESFVQKYTYGKDNLPTQYILSSSRTQTYSYDSLNRYTQMVLSTDNPITVNYIYYLSEKRNTDDGTYYRTTRLGREVIGNTAYNYVYDKLGNITQIKEGERVEGTTSATNLKLKVSYEYDALSQLTRENNAYLNQTITYTYDKGGNLTKKAIYPYTTGSLTGVKSTSTKTYTYGNSSWTDLLTAYDGQSITYDSIGNPLSYLGYTLTWNGRQLSSLKGNGVSAVYKYDADGLRSYKKVSGVESTYQYIGSKLVYEKRGDIVLRYGYNSFGDLAYIRYTANGTTEYYYVVCNSRGDVENLYTGSGALRAHYTYDSWGNVISITNANGKEITDPTHIGIVNPIRYRGYYYDNETGFYYLQSRYYNPQVGRFLNADNETLLGANGDFASFNFYIYCGNNPISRKDTNGCFWVTVGIMAVGGLIGTAISAVCSATIQATLTGSINWKSVGVAAATGFISGAIAASPLGLVGQQIAGGIIGGLSYAADCFVNDKAMKLDEAILSIGLGVISARIGGTGVNNKGAASQPVNYLIKKMVRESRRENFEFAEKAVISAINYTVDTLSDMAWSASIKFAAGCGVSNAGIIKYNSFGFFPNAPQWKPW